jgi:hypothetical protein
MAQYKQQCDKREAQRREQLVLGPTSARREVIVPPIAAHWAWIRAIDLEAELSPRPGSRLLTRILHGARGDVARAFMVTTATHPDKSYG